MASMKFYTAVGRLESFPFKNKPECPVVRLQQREYGLDCQEMLLWSSLNWRILRKEEIGRIYRRAIQHTGPVSIRSWEDCLQRLMTRGLVVSGYGESDYDALYDMLASLYIVPATGSFLLRLLTFAKLVFVNGVPFSTARRLFRKDHRSPCEQQIMRLASDAMLSTAEIIKCIDLGLRRLPNEQYLMEHLYNDDDSTSDNLEFLMKPNKSSPRVTVAVANLYLRQQIVFDRV